MSGWADLNRDRLNPIYRLGVPPDSITPRLVWRQARVYIWLCHLLLGCANQYVSRMFAKHEHGHHPKGLRTSNTCEKERFDTLNCRRISTLLD